MSRTQASGASAMHGAGGSSGAGSPSLSNTLRELIIEGAPEIEASYLSLQACAFFVLGFIMVSVSGTLFSRSKSLYAFALQVLEVKADTYFNDFGVQKLKVRKSIFSPRFEAPRLYYLQEDSGNASTSVVGIMFIILSSLFIFIFWSMFHSIYIFANFIESEPEADFSSLYIDYFLYLFGNEIIIFISVTLFGVSLYLSMISLMRLGLVTALYSALEGRSSLQENGLLASFLLSLLSISGSAASVFWLITYILEP